MFLKGLKYLAVLVLFGIGGALFLFIFTQARTPSYTARAVLAVPPTPSEGIDADPGRSTTLASTYAALLRRDRNLAVAVARRTGRKTDTVRRQLRVKKVAAAPLIEVSYDSASRRRAQRVTTAALRTIVSGGSGVLPERIPGSLRRASSASPARLVEPGRYRSRASILVTARPNEQPDPTGANRLAANVAALVPENDAVIGTAARQVQVSRSYFRSRLRVSNNANTSLIGLSFTGVNYEDARASVTALAEVLATPEGSSDLIPAGTLQIVRRPVDRRSTARSQAPTIVGAILGLVAGLGWILLRRRRDPLVRDRRMLEEALAAPAGEVHDRGPGAGPTIDALLQNGLSDRRVQLLEGTSLSSTQTAALLADVRSYEGLRPRLVDLDLHPVTGSQGPSVVFIREGTPYSAVRRSRIAVEQAGGEVVAGVLVR